MEIKLQCGDKINIPNDCKAIIEDGSIKIIKESEFKDGDVLCGILDKTIVLIFKAMSDNSKSCFRSYYNTKYLSNEHWNVEFFRHATESEKSQLFCQMKEQGLQWNAEEKQVKTIRWRAKEGEAYYLIDLRGNVFCEIDSRTDVDNMFYDTLNYFHTEEQAREAAKRRKETFKKYHEEI